MATKKKAAEKKAAAPKKKAAAPAKKKAAAAGSLQEQAELQALEPKHLALVERELAFTFDPAAITAQERAELDQQYKFILSRKF
jgi:hypothetical protein